MNTKRLSSDLETYKAKLLKGTPIALEHAETKWVTRENLPTTQLCTC